MNTKVILNWNRIEYIIWYLHWTVTERTPIMMMICKFTNLNNNNLYEALSYYPLIKHKIIV